MPAILNDDSLDSLRRAGLVESDETQDNDLALQLAALTARLDALGNERLDAVLQSVLAQKDQTRAMTALARALMARLDAPVPKKVPERWHFTVAARDRNGHIEALHATQVLG